MRVKRSLLSATMLMVGLLPVASLPALGQTVPFDISITNTLPQTTYPWSVGLLTLSPVLPLGASPQPGTPAYAGYSFANSNCDYDDTFCSGTCNDNGNAVVLAQRLGLTLGVNAWLVPALNGNNTTATVHIDVPQGAKLSFIAWINNTSVFDDFVAMHVLGNNTNLQVPLFDAQGAPLNNVVFGIDGYDVNSTSATDGSGATCSQECPAQATGCFVTWGNASASSYPAQPSTAVTPLQLTASGPTSVTVAQQTYTFTYRNTTGAQVTGTTLVYALPVGVTYVSSTNLGVYSAANRTVTWTIGTLANNAAAASRFVTVTLPVGTTMHSATASYTRSSRAYNVVSNVVSTLYSTALTATCTFTDSGGRFTDGISVGQLAGATNSARELAVVLPRGNATAGGAVVLNNNCVEQSRTSLPAGRDTQGFPLVQDLDGTTNSIEYAFGEGMSTPNQGAVLARTGASAAYWSSMPWGYPGFWNMGASGANVVGNANPDTVFGDWDGHLAVVGNGTTTIAAQTDLWASDGDHAFGHLALADVIGTTAIEAVLFGYTKGVVTVFNGSNLTKAWQSASLRTLYGDFAYGTGPAVGDIDGDGNAEIVVATYGSTSDIYAFDPKSQATGSTCKYRFDPGGLFTYTSPVIGDVDGSGRKSVVTISSSDGVVSVMKAGATGCTAGGTIVWQYTIKAGEGSAFSPLLYDVNGDGTLDVIAASQTRVVVLDVRNRTLLYTFDDSTATFAPSAVVVDSDSSSATSTNAHELWVTGWRNSKVYRINLPATATAGNEWNTFGGAPARTGAR